MFALYQACNWLVVLGFNAILTAKVIIMAVGEAHVFPGFLTPVLIQLFFPKPPTTFLTCLCRGERRKYARIKHVKVKCWHWHAVLLFSLQVTQLAVDWLNVVLCCSQHYFSHTIATDHIMMQP